MLSKVNIFVLVAGVLGSEIMWQIWKCIQNRSVVKSNKSNNVIPNKETVTADDNEILMFTEKGKLCRSHAITRIPCKKSNCPVGYIKKLVSYLSRASKTLDVCLYIMTCDDVTNAIIMAHRQSARVRVIVDSGMSENPACNNQILRMRRAGIEIRMNEFQPSSLMHHKFAVMDDEIVLFGSTNWTMQAFYGNNDSIVVTNNKKCVIAYSNEFDNLWRHFSP
ncbi:mitochondrial cardiolipin hydrolase [Venturia canescens]|uniref:mitochondrial cardiolipin hydrolase n=1 Tax=Venturia canescens TaxID=32260 RepID=UPI001C9C1A09|nr:mitochondrial cardiolipin hydrolase [Venturia canescens]